MEDTWFHQLKKVYLFQDVGKMKYFRGCLNESLRILPTIPYMGRLLPEEISLRGYRIPANTFVMWSAILLGKDPILFPNPEKFLPERWIEDKDKVVFLHTTLYILINYIRIVDAFWYVWCGMST